MVPLYEAKMIHYFDHRFSTYENATQAQLNKGTLPRFTADKHNDPCALPWPRHWVQEADVSKAISQLCQRLSRQWDKGWLLGFRDTTRSVDERTMIAAVIPLVAVGDKFLLALPGTGNPACLQANLSALVLDYCVRQKHASASLKYHVVRTTNKVVGWPVGGSR